MSFDMGNFEKEKFGNLPNGETVFKYTLRSKSRLEVEIIDYGATVVAIRAPDRNGVVDDIIVGYNCMEDFITNAPSFGATIGRFANRIGKGHFVLDGCEYNLAINCPPHHLHGGVKGFSRSLWTGKESDNVKLPSVTFSLASPDGDDGYPGSLDITVTYTVTEENELKIHYKATVLDKSTIINLTNHSYFNLAGQTDKNILDHELEINADSYLPVDSTCLPTGEIRSVQEDDGIFDFRTAKFIRKDIEKTGGGYDQNFCLNKGKENFGARVYHQPSGRVLEVFTSQPGIQLYTCNIDNPIVGKRKYHRYSAFCLETQTYPNAINQENFPSCILRPGEVYDHETVYRFSSRD